MLDQSSSNKAVLRCTNNFVHFTLQLIQSFCDKNYVFMKAGSINNNIVIKKFIPVFPKVQDTFLLML